MQPAVSFGTEKQTALNRIDIKSVCNGRQKGYDSMRVKVCGMSDIGQCRQLNEDSFRVCGFEGGVPSGACVLADGMGGHNAGEVASSTAAELIIKELAETLDEHDEKQITKNIEGAVDFANTTVYEMSLDNSAQAGMGTTLVIAYVKDSLVRFANIGDSRGYAVSSGGIKRITVDHSVVEELVQRGTITREEARNHPDKNIITRALGTEGFVDADFYDYTVSEGETIILCSDGLTEMVTEDEIKDIINGFDNIDEAVKALVDEANKNGGVDNITVVALQFEKEESII